MQSQTKRINDLVKLHLLSVNALPCLSIRQLGVIVSAFLPDINRAEISCDCALVSVLAGV